MSDEQKYTIQGLDEYIRQGEPQQVDRLQTSEYLLDTAKRHIEGDISISGRCMLSAKATHERLPYL
jgi:hypothetical protein